MINYCSKEMRDTEPSFKEPEIQRIFEAKMADLNLSLKLHIDQYSTFKRFVDRVSSNRKVKLYDVRSHKNILNVSKALGLSSLARSLQS